MARIQRINALQLKRVYWPRWGDAKRVLIAAGYTAAEAEQTRKDIHAAVTGCECSSKDLTNRTLDAVLAKFAAISAPSDGKRQADLADGACKRARFAISQALGRMGLAESYADGIARQMFRRPVAQCDEAQLKSILKALAYHETRHADQPF